MLSKLESVLKAYGAGMRPKSPSTPLLLSSLALKHVLNFKSFPPWAPGHNAPCQMSARAGVALPDVLLDSTRVP